MRKQTKREKNLWEKIGNTDIDYAFYSVYLKKGSTEMEISLDWDVCEDDQETQAKLIAARLKRELAHLAPVFLKEFQKEINNN